MTRGRAAAWAVACFAGLVQAAQSEEVADLSDGSRILSIGGSVTEIIYALGEEGRLIGRDSTSLYPEEALALPNVGYSRTLSPEGVLSVNPDAILMIAGSGPVEALEVLEQADIPTVIIPETYDPQGITEKVRIIGQALGVEDKAAELTDRIRQELETATAAARDGDHEAPRILFVMSLQGGKIMASGTGTAANGIIQMVGAKNAITDYSGYKQLNDEALIQAAPDVILTMEVSEADLARVDELAAMPAIAGTPAGQAKRIISMDGAYLLSFGPRTASAVQDLSLELSEIMGHE